MGFGQFQRFLFCNIGTGLHTCDLGMKVKVAQSYPTLCDPMDYTRVGSLSLLQGIFPTQGSNPDLLHCRQILYQLSHKRRYSSVQFSCSVMSDSLRPHESQHARPPYPSPTPRVYSNPCPSSRCCRTTISSSVVPFSSCPQSFSAEDIGLHNYMFWKQNNFKGHHFRGLH